MTYIRKNQDIWDRRSANDDRWSIPVSAEEIKLAREGVWHIVLTPAKPVPADWFPDPLAGFGNPISCIFDVGKFERGILEVKHSIPYADVDHLDDPEIRAIAEADGYLWSHTLEDQIQGQIEAGFAIIGFYEDVGGSALDPYIHSSMATKAVKL